MNFKLILIGGIVFYVVTMILGMFVMGPLVHDGALKEAYMATSQFWRPALNSVPPDWSELMARWVTTGLLASFIAAGVYGAVRSSFVGPGWKRGLKFGFVLFLLTASAWVGLSGYFNLPDIIWAWWCAASLVTNLIAGAALGWVADLKFMSDEVPARAAA